ncbi:MAG: hypothetical protein IMZ67_06865 [Acidobacteria bacterium]|nr:hypothetical protein [Acidobacteriota bacterium]
MKAKHEELLKRLREKPGGTPLTPDELKLLMSAVKPSDFGAPRSSSPIGGSGSYVHSGFSGYSGPGSMGGYSTPISSGPSGGLVIVAGAVLLGVAAALLYGGWLLLRWVF